MMAPSTIQTILLALALLAPLLIRSPPAAPLPPAQPETGPGAAEDRFPEVAVAFEAAGSGYWLFEPAGADADPEAGALPLVVFLGGCCMPDNSSAIPEFYRYWIDHIVRRGAVVVSPIYRLGSAAADVARDLETALAALAARSDPPVDLARVALVGHSYGAMLAAEYAATAAVFDLPPADAALLAMPGCSGCALARNLANLPESIRLAVLVADRDTVVGDTSAEAIWAQLGHIPAENRAYVTLVSDDHGDPPLIADHGLPTTGPEAGVVDALDWYGTWKFGDALFACAFRGEECAYALGDTPEQRFMGAWSDGVPVAEAVVVRPSDEATPAP